ncbi:MAG TPA: phage holin family protein [Polyangiaceae bacterium]|nr:phage holin family protein [Polyangiaceae bacterium]
MPVVHFLLQWLVLSLSFWLTAKLVPGFRVAGFWDAIVVAAVFGIANYFLGTFLFYLLGILTLGIGLLLALLTHWVVNAILLKITGAFTSRLQVKSFGVALVAALVMSLLGKAGAYAIDQITHHPSPAGSIYL